MVKTYYIIAGYFVSVSNQTVFVDGSDLYQPCQRYLSVDNKYMYFYVLDIYGEKNKHRKTEVLKQDY